MLVFFPASPSSDVESRPASALPDGENDNGDHDNQPLAVEEGEEEVDKHCASASASAAAAAASSAAAATADDDDGKKDGDESAAEGKPVKARKCFSCGEEGHFSRDCAFVSKIVILNECIRILSHFLPFISTFFSPSFYNSRAHTMKRTLCLLREAFLNSPRTAICSPRKKRHLYALF